MVKKVKRPVADPLADTLCPVARAETVVGDRWTVLILRELFLGSRRFEAIQAQTGATPQMVAARLKRLEADGLVERQAYSQRPLRYDYRLTPKGDAFHPVLTALRVWGESWCKAPGEAPAIRATHRPCGKPAGLGPLCEGCGQPLDRADTVFALDPVYAEERKARWDLFKAGR